MPVELSVKNMRNTTNTAEFVRKPVDVAQKLAGTSPDFLTKTASERSFFALKLFFLFNLIFDFNHYAPSVHQRHFAETIAPPQKSLG